jgi:hypothetical protein
MVKHIVFFKLSPAVLLGNRQIQLKMMEDIFSPLAKKLPFIVEYKTGINFNEDVNAWDFVIESVFKNKDDLQRYQISDEHKEAIKKGSEIKKTKAIIDYEY